MPTRIILHRDVTTEECGWLDYDLPAGTQLYLAKDVWKCSLGGIVASFNPDGTHYFEIPEDCFSMNFGLIFSLN